MTLIGSSVSNTANPASTGATTSATNNAPGVTGVTAETAYGEAYQRRLPELMALSVDDLTTVNVDIRAAIATVLGALPNINALRAQLAELPQFNLANLDDLEDYAEATGHAHSKYLGAAPQAAAELATINDEAVKARDTLQLDVAALTHRGLIDPKRFEQFKGLNGYKNVSFDVMGIADVLIECWPQVEGKTALTLDDLHNAKQVGERLIAAFGTREQSSPVIAEATLNRQRAFTLLSRSYDQVRRAVAFLRWNEDDVDEIAPSLFAGRGGRGKSETQQPPAAATGNAPLPAPVTVATHPAGPVPAGSSGNSPLVS